MNELFEVVSIEDICKGYFYSYPMSIEKGTSNSTGNLVILRLKYIFLQALLSIWLLHLAIYLCIHSMTYFLINASCGEVEIMQSSINSIKQNSWKASCNLEFCE
jgi:ABC-type amino acid transport system permease subunit